MVILRYYFCWLTFDATVILVNSKSRWTKLANGQVIFDDAGSVAGTAFADAGIDTFVVDASLVDGTTTILETDGDT